MRILASMERPKLFTWQDLVLSLVMGVILLVGLSMPNIIRFINGTNQEVAEQYFSTIETFADRAITELSERFLTPDIATFLLWAGLGLICYVFAAVFIDSTNDIVEIFKFKKKYIHPVTFKESTYLERLALHSFVGLAALSVLVGWALISLRFLVPYSMEQVYDTLFLSMNVSGRILAVLGAVGCMALSFYGILLFVRLLRIARHNFAN